MKPLRFWVDGENQPKDTRHRLWEQTGPLVGGFSVCDERTVHRHTQRLHLSQQPAAAVEEVVAIGNLGPHGTGRVTLVSMESAFCRTELSKEICTLH